MPRPNFTLPRLHVGAPLAAGTVLELERDQANYLGNVLRLARGAAILVFNGRDGEWRAVLAETAKRSVSVLVEAQTRPQTPTSRLTYAFAPLKHARLDYMVQKAVEMGAGVLQPVMTRRTQAARINGLRMAANVVEAAEQCGVLAVPVVADPLRLDQWLESWPHDDGLVFCDEDADVADPIAALRAFGRGTARLALLIGPEGGFEEGERQALLARPHVVRLSLGPRILRADTAAVAALAVIQAAVGDWGTAV